jgi:hypothetical protein
MGEEHSTQDQMRIIYIISVRYLFGRSHLLNLGIDKWEDNIQMHGYHGGGGFNWLKIETNDMLLETL